MWGGRPCTRNNGDAPGLIPRPDVRSPESVQAAGHGQITLSNGVGGGQPLHLSSGVGVILQVLTPTESAVPLAFARTRLVDGASGLLHQVIERLDYLHDVDELLDGRIVFELGDFLLELLAQREHELAIVM